MTYVENFRRQYHHIYPHRSALLLNPSNECGMPVSTTLFPYFVLKSQSSYTEICLYNNSIDHVTVLGFDRMAFSCRISCWPSQLWLSQSSLSTCKLSEINSIPEISSFQPPMLSSPTKILAEQHGNCFDYANLLCSLLIGAGYDAYIASGYATREICCMDTTRLPNPYSRRRETVHCNKILLCTMNISAGRCRASEMSM